MNPVSLDHFLYLPDFAGAEEGTLFELCNVASYCADAVVLIPYQNPQVQQLSPRFFSIVKRIRYKPPTTAVTNSPLVLKARTSKEDYLKKVSALKHEIQLGNIYEINFCIEFFAESVSLEPFTIFQRLHTHSKAPYSALLKTGSDYIFCSSPELFLKKEGRVLSSKPIKGTAKRGLTEEADKILKEQLFTSLKERTENVMAVDVARNDLSIVAERGSVKVNKLYNIESFETVHQMVSTVSCILKPNVGFDDIIEATFPMASMTGAPKLRAMTLSDRFEEFERHYYSGTMGLIDTNGDFLTWVIIRSIFYNEHSQRLSLAVGGAITYLSEPEKEYEECLLKAAGMLDVLNATIHPS